MFAKWVGGILVVAALFGLIGLVTIAPELAKNRENAGSGTDVTGNDSNSASADQQSDKGPHTWYKGAFCLGNVACGPEDCSISEFSPADLYQRFSVYGNVQITDGNNGEVDVSVPDQSMKSVLFRDLQACKTYVAEQENAAKIQEQQQQQELDKYR